MDVDPDRVDDAVLALLALNASGDRAWAGLDLDVLSRLHERGWISRPSAKSATVVFTPEGLNRARSLAGELFARRPE